MCGIAGILDPDRAPTEAEIAAMIACIPYRGPDGSGEWRRAEQGIALGHRRLSILDLSSAGAQPMTTAAGRYWLTYNGEIYNFVEIRSELVNLGHQFRSESDSEVLIAAYQQWGPACLEKFMGMYAFAIWDTQERELFAARDRLGIKPFYYFVDGSRLLFASEIKSILALTGARGVDRSLIDAYMKFGYVPGEDSPHAGVKRLMPGHFLRWRAGQFEVRRYWDLDFGAPVAQSIEQAAGSVELMLRDSIKLHLRSDVPLGVFLSGGLDSSAVVALLAENVSRGLKTFSVAYDFGPDYDETPYAREVARKFGTDHHEIRIGPQEFSDWIPSFIRHMDEPVTEAAAISLYYVSKLAREHVTVCLSGEGSDELFAGYDLYVYNQAMERARNLLPAWALSGAAKVAGRLRRLDKLRRYLELAGKPLETRYQGISSYTEQAHATPYEAGFADDAARGNPRLAGFLESLFVRSRGWDTLSRMLYFDTRTWLVDDLLIKADRMSMATSIELRVPFLDHRLVEHAAKLPSSVKISGTQTKRVLKHALRDRLPRGIIERRKLGFPTPLEIMFRGPLYDYAHQLLTSPRCVQRGYFQRAAIERLLSDHRERRVSRHREIWQLVVLEEWHRQFGY